MRIHHALKVLYFLAIIGCSGSVHAQARLGLPCIRNFPPSVYNQGTQNFVILQGLDGIIFIGNNNGVLTYDGHKWELTEVTNKSEVHAMEMDAQGKIYVGGQGDFGFLQRNTVTQKFEYTSLLPLLPEADRNFNDVWNIYCTESEVLFRSTTAIFRYNGNKISTVKLPTTTHRSFYVDNQLLVREDGYGVRKLVGDSLVVVPDGEKFLTEPIHSMLPYPNGKLLVVTENEGFYLYDGKRFTVFHSAVGDNLKGQNIYASHLSDSTYVLGTRYNGLIVMNARGEALYSISKNEGLINESVWSVCVDRFSGNLWVATNNGISFVEINSPFHTLQQSHGLNGQVYHTAYFEGAIYAATSLGVYSMHPGKSNVFTLVEGLKTQAWHFYQDSTSLLVAANSGIFEIRNNRASTIGFHGRAWLFLPLKHQSVESIFVNTANGFLLLRKRNQKFIVEKQVPRFFESLYYFTEDGKGNIWGDSPIKGIYKMRLPDGTGDQVTYQLYNKSKGFPTDYKLRAFSFGTDVRFSTPSGIYRYDEGLDSVLFDATLNTAVFSETTPDIDWIEEDKQRNLWFVIGKKEDATTIGGYSRYSKGNYTTTVDIFNRIRNLKIRDFLTLDSSNALLATSEGIITLKLASAPQQSFPVRLSNVTLTGVDSIIPVLNSDGVVVPYNQNNIRFEFVGMNFGAVPHEYETFLDGFDRHWQQWNESTSREYTNLPAGEYVFRVRARNAYNTISDELQLTVRVDSPWYLTPLAAVFYVITILVAIYALLYFRSRAFIVKTKRLESLIAQRTAELRREHDNLVRVHELLGNQKEEIEAQKDYIEQKNNELLHTKVIIDKQNEDLRTANSNLELAVSERTAQLQLAYHNLLQTKDELDTFIYRSSHDIKGPLLRILGLCRVALLDVQEEKPRQYLFKLENEILLTNKILHKLIVFHNVKNMPVEFKSLNLRIAVEAILEKLHHEEGFNQVKFLLDPTLDSKIFADQDLLQIALLNVIENAIVYRKRSAAEVRISLLETSDQNHMISISDNGNGVPAEASNHIFNMFYRGSETSKGAGLGLFITRKALQRMNADISLVDKTTFVINIPQAQTDLAITCEY